jgi:hypothetical protein
MLGLVQIGLLALAGDWHAGRLLAWGVFAVLLATALWVVWTQRIRIVVSDDGIRASTASGDRDFAWSEIRRIERETDPAMPCAPRHRTGVWRVHCTGGRGLRFSNASIGGAHRLADIIRAGLRRHRRPGFPRTRP